ncbi:hypothetical protein GCM10008959_40500 [Deinococcus seoulensis]|uniref:Uncharacterized protein n=1 Tax=Deinococcus seoulensis TaxID=1837379 RepID=A0ABQ2RYJ4_9DEIO|nr:hypothetical protein [Deinococcus seoulensis]GGR75296.1 hypothetical protein GCM10008959_40500 [Deinococcus seoulensis]
MTCSSSVLPGYTSDAFTGLYEKLKADDRNEYLAEGGFWVPGEAR